MSYSLNALYKEVGISKQAVMQYQRRQLVFDERIEQLTLEADELRAEHPGCGVKKMYDSLQPDFIGRDRFIEVMMDLGYRLKRKKNYRRTTYASKKFYSNLIQGLTVDGPSQVWQSDITYIRVGERFYYATFIIDVYTKKIVGYQLADHMRASANVQALKMALKDHPPPRIHHSDRGSQYTYSEYVNLLEAQGSAISMATSAQDNAYAERINRTIKEEYLDHWKPQSFKQLEKMLSKAVFNYNHKRPHDNLDKRKPAEFEASLNKGEVGNNLTIFNYNLLN
jgi:transposase-like protein